MTIDKKIEIAKLYQIYYKLLKKRQCYIFEAYYDEDLSIIEIADVIDVTKIAVYNQLQKIEKLLNHYEDCLNIESNKNDNIKLLSQNGIEEKIIKKIK